ncbi:MAG TPA: response regulator transcription factor [Ohtaekwangia sp.]
MSEIKILLVDDHAMLRAGLAAMLKEVPGIQVVGALSSGEEAVEQFESFSPDIILMDIMMKGMTGLEATRWIKERSPRTRIIIISSELKKEFISTGIKCGIDGYLPKDANETILLAAIHAVGRGEKYFNEAITSLVFEDYYRSEKDGTKPKRKITEGLSRRESEVLEQVALGKTNQEVADTLFISIKTVETHKTNILEKLGLRNTAELVRYAIRHNIVSLE